MKLWTIYNKKNPPIIGVDVDLCKFPKWLRTRVIFILLFNTSNSTFSEHTFSELRCKTYRCCGRRQIKYRQLYQRSPEGASDGGRRITLLTHGHTVVAYNAFYLLFRLFHAF